MPYSRYNQKVGTLRRFMGQAVVVTGSAVTCERAGRPKSWADFPVYVTSKKARTMHGAEFYYVQPGRNGVPSKRIYFNKAPFDGGEIGRKQIGVYAHDKQNNVYGVWWRGYER